MPELPEVETIRRDLSRDVTGLVFKKIVIHDNRVIRMLAEDFVRLIEGRRIVAVRRRGKVLLIDLGGKFLVVQPMMTGQLIAVPSGASAEIAKETKLIFELSKGWRLIYNDQRLFGRLTVIGKPDDLDHLRSLGPEPLGEDFTVDILRGLLHRRQSAVKTVLLDGKCVAGIGNIYASEILFCAGISPKRKASSLKVGEIRRLWQAIRAVLAEAVRLRGTSMRNYRDGRGREGKYRKVIKVYGRNGEPCRVCGKAIQRIVQAERSTFLCPGCQK